MRLGKMCGLLMKAFLAVLMLFVTAAAVEVYWEDEFDEAIANQCESIILKEEYLNMDFGEAIVVDFDTVLDLDGHELMRKPNPVRITPLEVTASSAVISAATPSPPVLSPSSPAPIETITAPRRTPVPARLLVTLARSLLAWQP